MTDLKDASRRVLEAARALGLEIKVLTMTQSTRTADDAAAACGCGVGQIVKSLVFRGKVSGRPYLLLVSGSNRVDEKTAAKAIGETLGRADAQYVRDITGYAIGGIPPIGHKERVSTWIDQDLLAHDVVYAAAGTPESVFAVAPRALAEKAAAKVIAVK